MAKKKGCPKGHIKINNKCLKITKSKVVATGRFVSGTKWKQINYVSINNKNFRKDQIVHWTDPDFGIHEDDKYQEYKFKINGFLIYDNNIDILPTKEKGLNINTNKWEESALGRIPLKDIHEVKNV